MLLAVKVGLYAVMALTLLAAVGVAMLPNLFHAALALVGTLLGIAAIYIALQADFLAAVQILIYVGAVMTLVIFAIMLTQRFGDKSIPHHNELSLLHFSGLRGFILAGLAFGSPVVFIVAFSKMILRTQWTEQNTEVSRITAFELGEALMREYVFPFEIISVILIAALIGAIVIARKDKNLS